VLVVNLIDADGVIAGPFAIVQAVAKRERSFVECGSDGQVGPLGQLSAKPDYKHPHALATNRVPLALPIKLLRKHAVVARIQTKPPLPDRMSVRLYINDAPIHANALQHPQKLDGPS
jgi:hypothetical protein